jgi:hypothetical protein
MKIKGRSGAEPAAVKGSAAESAEVMEEPDGEERRPGSWRKLIWNAEIACWQLGIRPDESREEVNNNTPLVFPHLLIPGDFKFNVL